jgi:nucleotide-binding universal stress UspA family protein
MLQHILIGLDGSPLAETILPYVSTIAQRVGADLTLLYAVHLTEEMLRDDAYRVLQPAIQQSVPFAEDYLRQVVHRLTENGLKVQSRVRIGDAATEILRCAQQERMDLIALATHGRSGLQRWFYGSAAEKVLHTTSTPLLLIRPTEDQAAVPADLTQIVVPLDGSPVAARALSVAEALAERAHVPLVLLRVVEIVSLDFGGPFGTSYAAYPELLDRLQETADNYVTERATALRAKGYTVLTETPVGLPADTIVHYAHAHPGSLVVMATHGRTGVANVMLGSVARRVVQHGNTPTLVVPSLTTTPTGSSEP